MDEEKKRVEWFPRVLDLSQPQQPQQQHDGYYEFQDPHLILLPFVWHGAANPGHVTWDNLLPMYKLLTMFGLWPPHGEKNTTRTTTTTTFNTTLRRNVDNVTTTPTTATTSTPPLLLINMPIQGYLFGACTRYREKQPCHNMMEKLLPLLGLSSKNTMHLHNKHQAKLYQITTTTAATPTTSTTPTTTTTTSSSSSTTGSSTLICARQGVAGMGLLSDHGWKEHGQYHHLDYGTIHNTGKSDLVYNFRNMVLRNMGITDDKETILLSLPYRITMAVNSTNNKDRVLSFDLQYQAMAASFQNNHHNHPNLVTMERYVMQDLSLEEQLQLATQSFFYLSACGGSVVMATFLPRGASLILYFSSHRKGKRHSLLDYDFWNNVAYIRVHWLPIKYMNEPDQLELLILLIQSEMDRVTAMRKEQQQQ
jgi:hypothetical protein